MKCDKCTVSFVVALPAIPVVTTAFHTNGCGILILFSEVFYGTGLSVQGDP